MNLSITTSECAWAQMEMKILGRPIKGLRAFKFSKTVEHGYLYGAGDEPLDIQSGNRAYNGSITVLGFEADLMDRMAQSFGFEDITEVPHEEITITVRFQKSKGDCITFYSVTGVSFKESTISMAQNATTREVVMPFIAMSIRKLTL